MSSNGEDKEPSEYIDMVQHIVEVCMQNYMTPESIVNTLHVKGKIDSSITQEVLRRLERENKEFFKAYKLRLAVMDQIVVFNRLLNEQVDLMHRMSLAGAASMPLSNGSHGLPVQQAYDQASQLTAHSFWTEDIHQHPALQTAIDMAGHEQTFDVPTNTMLHQISNTGMNEISNTGMIEGINGRIVMHEGSHVGNTYLCRAVGNAPQVHLANVEASVSSFSSVESNSQLPNGNLMDADASSFGFQRQNHLALFRRSDNTEIEENVLMSSFAIEETCNFRDLRGWNNKE